jgi:hypothetical protein
MHSISLKYFSIPVIHPDRNRNDQCAPRMPEPFVDVRLESELAGHTIKLSPGRSKQVRFEL